MAGSYLPAYGRTAFAAKSAQFGPAKKEAAPIAPYIALIQPYPPTHHTTTVAVSASANPQRQMRQERHGGGVDVPPPSFI